MSLASLLTAEQIIPEMKAAERWPAIVELIDLLVGLGKIKTADRDSILASLKQREETMSTGIGFGIAIPHCSSDRIEDVVAAFGRSTAGIEFDAPPRIERVARIEQCPVPGASAVLAPPKPIACGREQEIGIVRIDR